VALVKRHTLLLLPTRGNAAGGLILKQRNAAGDRSVLVAEVFGFQLPTGCHTAVWDESAGGLRVGLAAAGLPRPQPVGIFPFPASHLLLPPLESGEASEPLAGLLRGEANTPVPRAWRFFRLAAEGDLPAAAAAIHGNTPLDAYNRFVISGTPESLADLARAGDAWLEELGQIAAFAHGLSGEPPPVGTLDGELAALAGLTAAAAAIERDNVPAACELLERALRVAREPSPVFAATLLIQWADLAGTLQTAPSELCELYAEAAELAAAAAGGLLEAEAWMKLAVARQHAAAGSRGGLLEAIKAYQRALAAGIDRENRPGWFGQIQNGLGLAYLAMPRGESSDQLRTGIAVQSFRRALEVCDRQRDPDSWASVMMNLANALQYLPSSHPRENLANAVEAYEQVLEVRSRARDPVAHSRVLFNQANALAHLGIFKPAIEKLAEARRLFGAYECSEESQATGQLLDQIQQQLDAIREGGRADELF